MLKVNDKGIRAIAPILFRGVIVNSENIFNFEVDRK